MHQFLSMKKHLLIKKEQKYINKDYQSTLIYVLYQQKEKKKCYLLRIALFLRFDKACDCAQLSKRKMSLNVN